MPAPVPADPIDLDPVEATVVEALGDGEWPEHFAIRGQGGGSEIILVVDPDQLAGLTTAAGEVLQIVHERYPRALRRDEVEAAGRARPAVGDARRVQVAHFLFSHEDAGERIALLAVELPEDPVSDGASLFRIWLSREQVAGMILQIERLLGIPPARCPICGQPVGVNDHQCAREN